MKKILPIVAVLSAGAYIVYFLKNKARAGQNLKYEFLDIAIDLEKTLKSRFSKIYYDLSINLINSENASVVLKNINFNVSVNGKNLGNVAQTINFTVPAESTKKVDLQISFQTLGLISLIRDAIIQGLKFDINVNGFIETDLGRIEVNYNQIISI